MRIVFCGFNEELLAVGLVVPVAGCLCGEWSGYAFGVCQFECAVYFVGGDVVEELALVFLGQRLPVFLCGLQQCERSHYVCACKGERVFD